VEVQQLQWDIQEEKIKTNEEKDKRKKYQEELKKVTTKPYYCLVISLVEKKD
jgi:hypothetical protein